MVATLRVISGPFKAWMLLTAVSNILCFLSNLGYAVLGRTIENVTKAGTFEQLVEKEILQPLGMNNSGFDIRNR